MADEPAPSPPAMDAPSLTAAVRSELLAHPGVTERAHRFGGIVFHLGRHELGHLHGERLADLPFAPHVRDELIAGGRIAPEHVGSDSNWVSRRVDRPEDVAEIVELFRISYEYAAALPPPADDGGPEDSEREDDAPGTGRSRGARWRAVLRLGSTWPRASR